MKLRIVLEGYVPPSLNQSYAKHWTHKHREKMRALRELWFGLYRAGEGYLITKTSGEASNILLTASKRLGLYVMTHRKKSSFKSLKSNCREEQTLIEIEYPNDPPNS